MLTGASLADPVPGADSDDTSCRRMATEEKPVLLEQVLEMWILDGGESGAGMSQMELFLVWWLMLCEW